MPPKTGTGFGLPDGNDGWTDWTWFHARYPMETKLTILCEAPANYSGHYRKGRMVACWADRCPLCEMGLGNQARYVFSVVEWETRRVGLLELGRGQSLRVQEWAEAAGSLRGLGISIVRSSAKKQSSLEMQLLTEEAPVYFHHLEGPNPQKALEQTWARVGRIVLEEDSGSSHRSEKSA